MRALDLFAGARGWDVAAETMGWSTEGVEIMLEARATAAAAGLKTVGEDVRAMNIERGEYDLLLASPPCQTYSMAGNGEGRLNMARVLSALHDPEHLSDLDERTGLVLEPLRLALQGMPRALAWEQVPAVLPVWEACAAVLRDHGYSVATGALNAEQHGVPQTRRRAVLVARRDGAAAMLPTPTHSRYHNRNPHRFDEGVKPWVSMAEALGWGMTERPSMTVCGGGTDTGGAEPFGNAARAGIRRELEAGRWMLRSRRDGPAWIAKYGERENRTVDQPGPTLTGEAHRWDWIQHESSAARIRVTPEEAACLQTFPSGFPFQGKAGKVFQQIGNAVPPLLAAAILEGLLP